MLHPDLYNSLKGELSPQDFVTDMNRKILSEVLRQLRDGQAFDLTVSSEAFSPKEAGHAVMLMNNRLNSDNPKTVALDCIKVIKEEHSKLSEADAKNMSDDEWADMIKHIADNKREG